MWQECTSTHISVYTHVTCIYIDVYNTCPDWCVYTYQCEPEHVHAGLKANMVLRETEGTEAEVVFLNSVFEQFVCRLVRNMVKGIRMQ